MIELHSAPTDLSDVQTDAKGNKLSRSMSLTNLVMLGVSAQIGSGWLFAVLSAAGATGPAAVISWIVAAAFFGVVAMPWMELGAMLPRSGGPVRYPSLSHGLFTGWIVGGAYWVAAVAVTTLEAQAVLTYLSNKWPDLGLMHTSMGIKVLSWPTGILAGVALLGLFTLLNIVGIRALAEANRWVTVWKIAIPTITFILLFTAFKSANFTAFGFGSHGVGGILHAIPATGIAFAYLGFRQVLDFGGECKRPQRDIPIAIGMSIVIPMVVYVLLQVAFIGALDWNAVGLNPGNWDGLLASNWASAPLFEALITAGFGAFGTVLLIDAVASPAATGWVFMGSASRSTLALAENQMAPSGLRSLNRFHVPWISLVVSFVASCVFLAPLPSWYKLVSVVSVALLLSYLIGSSTMVVLRRTAPGLHRPFRLGNVGLWAPLSFMATLVMIYVAGFATLLNLMTVVFLTLPVYTGYIAVKHGWMSRPTGVAFSAVFLAIWSYINWAGGWFLICFGDPRKGGICGCFRCLASFRPMCSGRWTVVGVEVERPERSEDERPRGRRGSAAYCRSGRDEENCCGSSHLRPPVNERGVGDALGRAGAQPYLGPRTRVRRHDDGWGARRAGCRRVRPLSLSGKSTQQWGGDRNLAGAGRGHQLKCGQGTSATHG